MEFVLTPSVPEIRSGVIKCITRVAQSCKHRRQLETTDFFQLSHIIYSILFILLCVCMRVLACVFSWELQSASRAGCGDRSCWASVLGEHWCDDVCLSGCGCLDLSPKQQRTLQRTWHVHLHQATLRLGAVSTTKCNWVGFLCVSGCISVLVQLLSRESLALREAATQALSNLTHNSESNALWVTKDFDVLPIPHCFCTDICTFF